MSGKHHDLTGRRFGRLVALKYAGPCYSRQGAMWLCRCDCGNLRNVAASSLVRGLTRSCGCYTSEVSSRNVARATVYRCRPVLADGILYPSQEAAARATGCSRSTVSRCLLLGKKYHGITFTKPTK